MKSHSRTVWSYLWGEGGQGNFKTVTYHELQLSLFPCQLLSGSETCSKRGALVLCIRPVLNGIDGSVSTLAHLRDVDWSCLASEELCQN